MSTGPRAQPTYSRADFWNELVFNNDGASGVAEHLLAAVHAIEHLPLGRERACMLTHVEEAIMWLRALDDLWLRIEDDAEEGAAS